ncbi:TadE family type IV pilus minor pilin [Microbacterium sp. NPDC055903]
MPLHRYRGRCRGDEGSAAAELAIATPAVLLALLLGVSALGAAATQVALQDAAADAARLIGRGEPSAAAASVVAEAVAGAGIDTAQRGDLVCVTASASMPVGGVLRIPLRAASCALAGGL